MTADELAVVLFKINQPMPLPLSMSTTFHPDEVPSHLKDAARDCQDARRAQEERLLGGLNADEVPSYPDIPHPQTDGQTYAFPVYNTLSGQHLANLHYIAAGGIFIFIEREDLTCHAGRCIL